jgi:hypothetical protein
VNDVVYLPDSSLQTTCKNSCVFTIGNALIAWSVDMDANPAAVGEPNIGNTSPQFVLGKVLFQAFIGGTDWTDAYATFDKTTFVPTINSWVVKR